MPPMIHHQRGRNRHDLHRNNCLKEVCRPASLPEFDTHYEIGQEKQKKLLESNAGHFSMLKALHMADYITALNGKSMFTYT